MKKFAVFDIDGTLYRWQLYHELVKTLALEGVFSETTFNEIDDTWNRWRGGEISFNEYEKFVIRIMSNNLPKVPVPLFEATCDKVVDQSAHSVYHYSKTLLKELKEQGYTIIAISGSQQELVERFGTRYGFDIVIGALYERQNGHFTGKMQRRTVENKAEILKEIVKQHGLSWKDSVAIGDSDGDIKLLELVEQPIAFNPSEGLFERAKAEGWPIVIERKNIAYRLEKHGTELVLADTISY